MNNAGTPLTLHWATFEGDLKQYASIPHGGQHRQQTHKAHPWVLLDASEEVFGVYVGAWPLHTSLLDGHGVLWVTYGIRALMRRSGQAAQIYQTP